MNYHGLLNASTVICGRYARSKIEKGEIHRVRRRGLTRLFEQVAAQAAIFRSRASATTFSETLAGQMA